MLSNMKMQQDNVVLTETQLSQILLFQQHEITTEHEYNTLCISFIYKDCVCMHVQVTNSIVANSANYPTGVRPLLVYY